MIRRLIAALRHAWIDYRDDRDAARALSEEQLRARFDGLRHGLAPDRRLSPADEREWALIEAGLVVDADLRTVLTDLNARMGERQT